MKTSLFVLILVCSSAKLCGQTSKDKEAIQSQIEAMVESWNQHDFSDMENYTTEDVDWVNVVGMWWKGRDEVQFAHQAFHETMFRNVNLELKFSNIRFITDDVAVAHIITHYGEYQTPDGNTMGNTDDIATLVYVKKNGRWLLTAGENVSINEAARTHNPVNKMSKQ